MKTKYNSSIYSNKSKVEAPNLPKDPAKTLPNFNPLIGNPDFMKFCVDDTIQENLPSESGLFKQNNTFDNSNPKAETSAEVYQNVPI